MVEMIVVVNNAEVKVEVDQLALLVPVGPGPGPEPEPDVVVCGAVAGFRSSASVVIIIIWSRSVVGFFCFSVAPGKDDCILQPYLAIDGICHGFLPADWTHTGEGNSRGTVL
jgi:hypothetical protein